jgi:CDP-diacylglycerol--serine O-phosphatidyltransferase
MNGRWSPYGRLLVNWRQVIPTTFTVAAMLAGFLSILVTFEAMRTQHPDLYRVSAKLILAAMILDGLDGNLARMLRGSSEFGAELDTYVDLTAFGIAPAILVFAAARENAQLVWRVLLPSAVALSGVVRLARFKVKDPLRGQAGYSGLPITANAGWVAMFVYISKTPASMAEDPYSLNRGWFAALFLAGIVAFVTLQVTTFRYPKPTKKAYLFVPTALLVVLWLWIGPRVGVWLALAMLILGLAYCVCGPLFVKGMAVHKARKEARAQNAVEAAQPEDAEE